MAGMTLVGIEENIAALNAAGAAFRQVMAAGGQGAVLAAPDIGDEVLDVLHDLISVPGPEPSAPGEPPHYQTGELYDSYDYDVSEEGDTAILDVGSSDEVAAFLEFGTSRMEARPHLRPAIEAVQERIPGLVAYRVAEAESAAIAGLGG